MDANLGKTNVSSAMIIFPSCGISNIKGSDTVYNSTSVKKKSDDTAKNESNAVTSNLLAFLASNTTLPPFLDKRAGLVHGRGREHDNLSLSIGTPPFKWRSRRCHMPGEGFRQASPLPSLPHDIKACKPSIIIFSFWNSLNLFTVVHTLQRHQERI